MRQAFYVQQGIEVLLPEVTVSTEVADLCYPATELAPGECYRYDGFTGSAQGISSFRINGSDVRARVAGAGDRLTVGSDSIQVLAS